VPAKGARSAPVSELRSFLADKLPAYMVPSAFVELRALPHMPNGKVDRNALPAPEHAPLPEASFVPPRDAVEEALASIWSQVLGVPRVGALDNFFDLGGHSLLAVHMLVRVEAALGRKLPLSLLFEDQTLEKVAARLREPERVASSWPTLVPIQPQGDAPPLFCVSRPNVNALGYVALARHMGRGQPVYGLQAQLRDESERPYERAEIVELAERYLAEMRRVQPRGPYFLCGFCEGALIAFEMARLLGEEGEEVGFLGILDAFPIENTRRFLPTVIRMFGQRARKRLARLAELRGVALAREAQRAVASAPAALVSALRSLPFMRRAPSADEAHGLERLEQQYWPGPDFVPPAIACTITVFRVAHQPWWRIADPELGWGPWTTRGVEVHHVPGEHTTLLREPQVRALAAEIRGCVARPGTVTRAASGARAASDAQAEQPGASTP
jgi:thioesterase domain-containing protein/acyl carrier protein